MKRIYTEDISALSDIVVELPPFAHLKSQDNIKEILQIFMEDLYIKQPEEMFDIVDYKLTEKTQETFFANYGIDKKYSRQLKGNIKDKIAFNLEQLFQNKGSKVIFKLFAQIFENIFRKINFYNIEVHKIPSGTGFSLDYRLDPLYITDKNNMIKRPHVPVEKTRKYLMELENFEGEVMWPVPTNFIYIQFAIGEEVINNMDVFLNGIRMYSNTYNSGKYVAYTSVLGVKENIYLPDLEFITNYIHLEIINYNNSGIQFDFPDRASTYLFNDEGTTGVSDLGFLCTLQKLMRDYKKANPYDRNEMENIRRRWQFILKTYENNVAHQKCSFNDFDSIYNAMETRYPRLQEDIKYYISLDDPEKLYSFILKLHAIFISGVYSNQRQDDASTPGLDEGGCTYGQDYEAFELQWVLDYVDVVFSSFFIRKDFVDFYFNPVMNLFVKYFFPVEVEYLKDLISKVFIKDKWNTIGTAEKRWTLTYVNSFSLHTLSRGLDHRKVFIEMHNKQSYIYNMDIYVVTPIASNSDIGTPDDAYSISPFAGSRSDRINPGDGYRVRIIDGSGNFKTKINYCFKLNRTKEYQPNILSKTLMPLIEPGHTKK
jgi:hypothetical protein